MVSVVKHTLVCMLMSVWECLDASCVLGVCRFICGVFNVLHSLLKNYSPPIYRMSVKILIWICPQLDLCPPDNSIKLVSNHAWLSWWNFWICKPFQKCTKNLPLCQMLLVMTLYYLQWVLILTAVSTRIYRTIWIMVWFQTYFVSALQLNYLAVNSYVFLEAATTLRFLCIIFHSSSTLRCIPVLENSVCILFLECSCVCSADEVRVSVHCLIMLSRQIHDAFGDGSWICLPC